MGASVHPSNIKSIAELLAVLVAENGSYAYVDKLGYAQSKDLVMYYLREALRDFHSLKNKPKWEKDEAQKRANNIDMEAVEMSIQNMEKISGMKELREIVSLITAKALAIASKLMKEKGAGPEETSSSGI